MSDESDIDVQLDYLLAFHVRLGLLKGDQALSVAQHINRHVVRNGHDPQKFPLLKEARKDAARIVRGNAWRQAA